MATTATHHPPAHLGASRRFGSPQVVAVALLFIFLAEGFWLIAHTRLDPTEMLYIHPAEAGALRGAVSSPLTGLVARFATSVLRAPAASRPWSARLPFLVFGTLLGASVWYVARRLYGNAGGYIALALYTFSPTLVTYSARVQPEIAAAWGVFGSIFTAIAVAHTLYAPREVILWNWKRILLLGTAIGVAASAKLATMIVIVIGSFLMLYLVPQRRRAALAIMAAACAVAVAIFTALHRFYPAAMSAEIGNFDLFSFVPRMLLSASVWRVVGVLLLHNGPGFILLLAGTLITFAVWRHTRFFGTLAPLLTALVLVAFGLVFPHAAGFAFLVIALPFLFVFVAGVCADLLESRAAPLALGVMLATLVMHAYFSLGGLLRLR